MVMQSLEVQVTTAPHDAVAAARNTGTGAVDATALRFDHAMRRFETSEWKEAFAELCALADRGHPTAARIALMLVRRGTSLFGGAFTATRERQARWHHLGGS